MLAGYRCPPTAPTVGANNSLDHCLAVCPHKCLPSAVLFAIFAEHLTNPHRGNMISPSALSQCRRSLVWERTRAYYQEPQKLYAAVRGVIIHGFLERPWLPRVETERRVYKQVTTGPEAPYVISGQLDAYDPYAREICDYKTLAEKGAFTLRTIGVKPEHVLQTNVYRWLVDGGHLDSLDGPIIHWPVERIVIHHLFMNRVVSSGQRYREIMYEFRAPNHGKPYKLEVGREQEGKTKRGCPIWEITFDLPAVPILSDGAVLAHIEENAPPLVRGFRDPSYVPPCVAGTDDDWQCAWCGVRPECDQYEAAQREAAGDVPPPTDNDQLPNLNERGLS